MERAPSENSEIYDVRTLSSESKIRNILEIFDLGKDNEKNKERKDKFMDLLKQYKHLSSQKNKKTRELIYGSDSERKKIHDQIMDVLAKMSLSVGLPEDKRKLVEFLANNRDEVEIMIKSYFSINEPVTVNSSNYLKMKEQLDTLSMKTGPEEE